MKHLVLIAVGLALTLPLQAKQAAAGGPANAKPNPRAIFKKMDKDGDGFLSKDEFTAKAKDAAKATAKFAKLDKNSDGKLSPAEVAGKGKGKHADKAKKGKQAGKAKKAGNRGKANKHGKGGRAEKGGKAANR